MNLSKDIFKPTEIYNFILVKVEELKDYVLKMELSDKEAQEKKEEIKESLDSIVCKLKININSKQIKPQVVRDVNKAIDKTLEVWLDGIELALGEFEAVDHLPTRILLCGGGSSLDRLVEALKVHKWSDDLPFTRTPSVTRISPSDIVGITNHSDRELDHTYITTMGLLRVGFDTIIGSNSQDTVREKLNRLLRI